MKIDADRIDEAALALFYLTLQDGGGARKGLVWERSTGSALSE